MTEAERMLAAQVEDLTELVGQLREELGAAARPEPCVVQCPYMDADAAAQHARHHEFAERVMRFLDDTGDELRKSVIRAIPRMLLAVLYLAAIGAAAVIVAYKWKGG